MLSPEEFFRVNYFIYIVDKAISLVESRFEQFKLYEDIFGFLLNIHKLKLLDVDNLKKNYLKHESFIKHALVSDVDDLDLCLELKVIREVLQIEITH